MEYRYDYEAEVLSGIHSASEQLVGLRLRADVRMQVLRDGYFLAKVPYDA